MWMPVLLSFEMADFILAHLRLLRLPSTEHGLGWTLTAAHCGRQMHPQVKWTSSTSGEISVGDSGRLELHFPDSGLVWTITFRRNGEQSATISSHIRNTSATPVKLGRC